MRALAPQAARCEDAPLPPGFADVPRCRPRSRPPRRRRRWPSSTGITARSSARRWWRCSTRGRAVDAETLLAHRARAERWRGEIDALFERCDVLLAPSAVGEAPEGLQFTGDPIFCRPWSLLGLPCDAPALRHRFDRAAGGLQLVGRHGDDHRLLAAAQWCMDRLA